MAAGRTLVATILAIMALFVLPQPSAAVTFPCTGALGEKLVSAAPDSTGEASVPMCERMASTDGSPPVRYDFYAAVASHFDVDDVWFAGSATTVGVARDEALNSCNRDMGSGCFLMDSWANSSATIFRDANGSIFVSWDGIDGGERDRILTECSAKQILPCEEIHRFDAKQPRYAPNLALARKLYAVAAWTTGDAHTGKLYIASGHPRLLEAEAAVLAACKKATGVTCESVAMTGNGVIQPYTASITRSAVVVERSAARARQTSDAVCSRRDQICTQQRVYDSRVPGIFVHDYAVATGQ